ncbi:MAG: HAD family hydrolase [Alphaproteobacteria bacterium]|nr:HAD family hydrolase [Alphaproteobacteria bacterium]
MTAGARPPAALLFDWDNTLVDNWEVIREATNATLEAFGMATWSLAETRRYVARSARDGFPKLFGARWQEAEALFYERFAEKHLTGLTPIADAEDMLRTACGQGLWLAVVSNKRGDLLRAEAAHLGWQGLFRQVIGATDAAEDKPGVAPVDLALAGSGIVRGPGVWFVGDGAVDMECARNAGCTAVLFDEPSELRSERAAHYNPEYVISSHSELIALVRGT